MSQQAKSRILTGIFLILAASLAFITPDALLLRVLYSVFAILALSEWLHHAPLTTNSVVPVIAICGALCFFMLSRSQLAIAAISAFVYDTVAYCSGKLIGKKLIRSSPFPHTSPRKTWEGLTIGLAASIGICFLLGTLWPSLFLLHPAYYIIAGPCAAIGDYRCSHYKRSVDITDCGTKLTSRLLPGHGGFTDRFLSHFVVAIGLAFTSIALS